MRTGHQQHMESGLRRTTGTFGTCRATDLSEVLKGMAEGVGRVLRARAVLDEKNRKWSLGWQAEKGNASAVTVGCNGRIFYMESWGKWFGFLE